MTERCADLDLLLDGELMDGEAATFRKHLTTCERCLLTLRSRMQERGLAVGAMHERVEQSLIGVVDRARTPGHRSRLAYLAPIVAAAAAFAIWLGRPEPSKPFELSVSHSRGSADQRGDAVHPGDVVRATVHGERYRAIWVYGPDHRLVIACPGGAQYRDPDEELALEFRAIELGGYTIIALGAVAPIMAPPDSLDAISDAAADARVEIRHVDVK